MKTKILTLILGGLMSTQVWAYGVGQSTHPMAINDRLLATEFTGILSDGTGMGVQVRYTQKLNKKIRMDGGLGIAGGDRSSRMFVGADYEIFPDYEKQPRVSVKLGYENASEFGNRINSFSITPTASKGFSFWGKEGYPFVAVPISVGLNSSNRTYETSLGLTGGWTGKVPLKIESLSKLTASAELNLGLKDTYTGVFVGLSYPIK
ncbi:MAG: hypothetical protein CME61_04250 [Halobacteriovoraceae bacterium]|nr:hypothetical protein [Halobacteriovoraceae bacterium]